MKIKRGNDQDLIFTVVDQNNVLRQDLSLVTAAHFVLKRQKTDANINAVVSKSLGSGIAVNDPGKGQIKVSLSSADMQIEAREYYCALQIVLSAKTYELNLIDNELVIDKICVTQDIYL